ncbi:TSUP family transporter [Mitsuokella sp.]
MLNQESHGFSRGECQGILTGLVAGFLAGAFGLGAAVYIQLALMVIFGIPLLESIGTCMLVILPISAAGGLGYLVSGHLVFSIFTETLMGLMIGAWFGAKATHLAPMPFLKAVIVLMPLLGGLIMMMFQH